MLVGVALGARLEQTYLPPESAATAGGSGQFLSAPKQSFGGSSFSGSGFAGSAGAAAGARFAPKSFSRTGNTYGAALATQPHIPILKYSNENLNGQYRYE